MFLHDSGVDAAPAETPLEPGDARYEALLTEDPTRRYSIVPIKYADLWEFYEKHASSFWTTKEVDLSSDQVQVRDHKNFSDGERKLLKTILAFFAGSDVIVAANMRIFMDEVKIPEAQFFYGFQVMMENIHSEMYGRMIEMVCENPEEQHELNTAVYNFSSVQGKAMWAESWMDRSKPFAQRLIAFAIVEGVFFSASFCAIFWFKQRGKLMDGLGKSNEFIARDEGIHTEFAVHLYREYISPRNKLSLSEMHQMFLSAYELENAFIDDAIPENLLGLNKDTMKQYVRFVVDYWLQQLGVPVIEWSHHLPGGSPCAATNPFSWMEMLSLQGKTNFFEQRVSEYQMPDLSRPEGLDFDGDADF